MIATHGLGLVWPDGTECFTDLDLQIPVGRSALVGENGSGKSTLLRLLAGLLPPTTGHVSGVDPDSVGYLPQDLLLDVDRSVAEHLDIAAVRAALRRIDVGRPDPEDYLTVGDRWDIEDRVRAGLARAGLVRAGLPSDVLDRSLGELSGGEVMQLGLARVLLDRPAVTLLDEPTNNLDATARARLLEVLASLPGTVVVVSHDPELLEVVDRIGEVHPDGIGWYGGGYSAYVAQVEVERAAAEQAVTSAKADVRRQREDLVDSERVLAARRRYAKKMFANTREPRAVMRARSRTAQVSAATYTRTHQNRLAEARERLATAEAGLREDSEVRVDLPSTVVASGRTVLRTRDLVLRTGRRVDLDLRGPERVALVGDNGSGKSTLLHTLAGRTEPRSGAVDVAVPFGLLPQRLDVLDEERSIVANLATLSPDADPQEVRARLARFGFRGPRAEQVVSRLSGGERFRATLAALLLADPAPQLLLLDEPTNSLDLSSRRALLTALEGYGGALLVASHDDAFLRDITITRSIRLG